MNETHRFQVSISCWRLEIISINVHKTLVECFEYRVAPRRDHPAITTTLTRSSLCYAMPLVSLTRPPRYPDRDHSSVVTKLLIEHRVT